MTIPLRIIDAHTHIQFPEFDNDREDALKRAADAGIGIINAGTDTEMSRKAVELAHAHENMWATVGIHPTEKGSAEELIHLADDEKVVGIGECGLDYFRVSETESRKKQKELFEAQIELAHKMQKPLVLHVRSSEKKSTDAFDDVLEVLSSHRNILLENPGICHFFTGTKDIAKKFLDLNLSFTFGGLITYNREFDEVLEYIPANHLLTETDAPFVAPKSHRGHRNEPSFVAEVAKFLADFKKVHVGTFLENAKRAFSLRGI
jgi:TatD DNase family protein